MITYFYTCLFFFTFLSTYLTAEQKNPFENTGEYEWTFLLPVNWKSKEHYNLTVKIPKNFKALQSITMMDRDEAIIEFIPKNESANNWSEIITVQKSIGKKISAKNFIDPLKKSMLGATKGKLRKYETDKLASLYNSAILALTYDYQGRHEIFEARYFSGPYDLAGVQYTIRTSKGFSDQQAIEKIEQFYNEQVKITQSK